VLVLVRHRDAGSPALNLYFSGVLVKCGPAGTTTGNLRASSAGIKYGDGGYNAGAVRGAGCKRGETAPADTAVGLRV